MPWKDGNHHWIPERGPWAKENPALWKAAYGKTTTHLTGEEHQKVQSDEKKYGPAGSAALYDMEHCGEAVEALIPDVEIIDDE
jgi:hypothetical protein